MIHLIAVRVRFALCVHFRRSGPDSGVADLLQMSGLFTVATGVVATAACAIVALSLSAAPAASTSALTAPASASSVAAAVAGLPAF